MSGTISSDQTWSGTIHVTGATTIAAGATVTVEAGTEIDAAVGAGITIAGTLDVQGTQAGKVTIQPIGGAAHFAGISVQAGGTYNLAFGVQVGGGIHVAGTATITDSKMWNASGDFLTSGGASAVIDMSYSQLGDLGPNDTTASTDTTHCDLHFDSASSISITHSNLATAAFGLMLYTSAPVSADLTDNNWYGNTYDIEPNSTAVGSADGGYFRKGAPTGLPGVSAKNLSATVLTDAGPRG